MVLARPVAPWVLSCFFLVSGCAVGGGSAPRMVPEPAHSVQQELGYNDVVRLSQEYATAQGYDVQDVAQAQRVRPNYWRVRFGLAPQGSGRVLDLDFDEAQQRVVGSTELDGAATGGSGPVDVSPVTPGGPPSR
jgi:hypothetical protein